MFVHHLQVLVEVLSTEEVSSQIIHLRVSRLVLFLPLQQLSIRHGELLVDGCEIWPLGCPRIPADIVQGLKLFGQSVYYSYTSMTSLWNRGPGGSQGEGPDENQSPPISAPVINLQLVLNIELATSLALLFV